MKKILILGAGNAQYDAIKYCKQKGYEVHALSYTDTDKAIVLCDFFEKINIVDEEKVQKYAEDKSIDLIYSVGSDIAMPTVMKVSENLKKPHFVSYETAKICNSKHMLREELGRDFVGNVPYKVVSNLEEIDDIDFFPVMIKPVDSQGQRGVYRCDCKEDISTYFERSLSFSRQKRVIIEKFLEGDEISVNAYMLDGKMVFSLISDRISFDEFPGGIIKEHVVPSKYEGSEISERVYDLTERVLKKLNINNGPAYFQIMIAKDNYPYLIEVTPRLDGCHMWNLIKHSKNIDLMDLSFEHLLNGTVDIIPDCCETKSMKLHFICQAPNTKFEKTKIENEEDKVYSRIYYEEGDNVRILNGYMEKCGYYIE